MPTSTVPPPRGASDVADLVHDAVAALLAGAAANATDTLADAVRALLRSARCPVDPAAPVRLHARDTATAARACDVGGVVEVVVGDRSWSLTVGGVRPDQVDDHSRQQLRTVTGVAALVLTARPSQRDREQLTAATRLTGLGLWELDVASGRHTWSREMFRLVGLEPDGEAPDIDAWLELVHPQDLEQYGLALQRSGPQDDIHVVRVRHADGGLRWLESWSSTERDAHGRPVRVWGATTDVTERELAARAGHDSELRLAEAYALAGLAWWEWHVATGTLVWSEGMRTLSGLGTDEPTIAAWLAVVHPDDQAASEPMEQAALRDGTSYIHVFRICLPDGSTRHLQSWTGPLRGRDGSITGLRGATLDVTERAQNELALADSEALFRAAFDEAPHGMAMVGLVGHEHGRLLRANHAYARLLGRDGIDGIDDITGRLIADWTPPEDLAAMRGRLAELAGGRTTVNSYPRAYLRADGSLIYAWVTTTVITDRWGVPQYTLAHCIDDTERRRQQSRLEQLALTDGLTGLANRTAVERALALALTATGPTAVTGVLLLDVDRFKLVNDSKGHPVGDALLVQVAARLRGLVGAQDVVARLGGDEFLILVAQAPGTAALVELAERVLADLRRPYDLPGGDRVVVTSSLGIAATHADVSGTDELLKQADLALYRAKDSGRDRFAVYDQHLHARAMARVDAEGRLRAGLRDGGLRLVLQSVVRLSDGQVVAGEALVRLVDPELGELPPGEFIDVAEDTGLIADVDAWMLTETVRLLQLDEAAVQAGAEATLPPRIAVNVSGRTLSTVAIVPLIRALLATHGVSGRRLVLELTETSLLSDSAGVLTALAELAELGVDVGIDDFGTGYSAMAYLQHFPLSFLKIDMSFVQRLGTSPRSDAVVAAIVELAHAHDLVVTAEGVETRAQADALAAMGCNHAQGWLFGRPVSPASTVVTAGPRSARLPAAEPGTAGTPRP